ncbi:hypothetical protein LINPERPRIM_LOCUS37985, partial [Linum perenne]
MDKSWIHMPRNTPEYYEGIEQFLNFAFAHADDGTHILCPCPKCNFKKWKSRSEVHDHLSRKRYP